MIQSTSSSKRTIRLLLLLLLMLGREPFAVFGFGLLPVPQQPKALGTTATIHKHVGRNSRCLLLAASDDNKSAESIDSDDDDTMAKKIASRKQRLVTGYEAAAITELVALGIFMTRSPIRNPLLVGYFMSGPLGVAAICRLILTSAATNDRLSSATYLRLNQFVGLQGFIGLLKAFIFQPNIFGYPMYIVASLLTLINTIKGYSYGVLGWDKAKPYSDLVSAIVENNKDHAKGLLHFPTEPIARTYDWITSILNGLKLYTAGEIVVDVGKAALMHAQPSPFAFKLVVGSHLARFGRQALLAAIAYTLRDAAERDRLQGTTFIQLNALLSLTFATMAIDALVLRTGVFRWALSIFAASSSIFCGGVGLQSYLAKKQGVP